MDKIKLMVTDDYSDNAIPVDWNKLPEALIEDMPGKYLTNVLSVLDNGDIIEKTVVLVEPVKKFREGILMYEDEYLKIGIDE